MSLPDNPIGSSESVESEIDPMDMSRIGTIWGVVYLSHIREDECLRLHDQIDLVMIVFVEDRLQHSDLW
jgi:hypothetical protein